MSTEQKTKPWVKYLMYVILMAFVAPYFFGNRSNPNQIIKIGHSSITHEDKNLAYFLASQEQSPFPPEVFFLLREEGFYFTNPFPFLLQGLLPLVAFSLEASDHMVDQYIQKQPAHHKNGNFSTEQYYENLKKLKITDSTYRYTVKNWISTKQLFLIPQLITQKIIGNPSFRKHLNETILPTYQQIRSGEYIEIHSKEQNWQPSEKEIKDYHLYHKQEFQTQPNMAFDCIKFENCSDEKFGDIIKDFQEGMGQDDITSKWQAKKIKVFAQNGKMSITDSKEENTEFASKIKEISTAANATLLNKPMLISTNNHKYIYTLKIFEEGKNKTLDNCRDEVIAKLQNQKTADNKLAKAKEAIKQWDKQINKYSLKVKLSNVLPTHFPGYKKEHDTLTQIQKKIGQALFSSQLNQHKIVAIGDSVYVTRFKSMQKEQNTVEQNQHIAQQFQSKLYMDIIQEYLTNIQLRFS